MESTTFEENRNFDIAAQEPTRWAAWATKNPNDSIKIWKKWISEGRNVSVFTDFFTPTLTKCGSFPYALAFAQQNHLKKFRYEENGIAHIYSTTPVRRSDRTSTGTASQSTSGGAIVGRRANASMPTFNEPETQEITRTAQQQVQPANGYKERVMNAVRGNNLAELEAAYQEAINSNNLTRGQKIDIRSAYRDGKAAIKNQIKADNADTNGRIKTANRAKNRAAKKLGRMEPKLNAINLNEAKDIIKSTLLSEIKALAEK